MKTQPLSDWRWYVPWLQGSRLDKGWDGKPRWIAEAVWGYAIAYRWSRWRLWARLSAIRGVFFYRLLQFFTHRWSQQKRYVYPRWYQLLVD